MSVKRGMITLEGVCYRIEKADKTTYNVYRILDNELIGSFERLPKIRVLQDFSGNVREIAIQAIRLANLSWTGKLDLP
ncbi:MAG: hypothetical protein ABFD50_04615 [Smithella sp.]